MRALTLLLFFSVPTFAAPYDLKDAIRYAIEHNPTLNSESQRERIADLERANANARFLPSLDATATHGLEKSSPQKPNDPWVSSLNLTLTESLYDNGQTLTQSKIARLNHDVAALTLLRARHQLALDIALEFYRYSSARALAEVKREQAGILKKQFESLNGMYRQGLKTKRDFLRLKSQAQRAEIFLQDALIDVDRTRVELMRLMGLPSREEAEFKTISIEELPHEVPEKGPELERSFDVRVAAARRAIAPEQVSLAERKYWPQVFLTTGATYDTGNYLGAGAVRSEAYGWNAMLALKYNLLDWGERSRDVEKARRNALISDNDLSATKQTTDAEIRKLMLELKQRTNNFRASKTLLEVEEDNFGLLKRDYEAGKVTSYDLILNLNDLLGARELFYRAQYGLAEGIARYHYYDGNLYEKLSLQ